MQILKNLKKYHKDNKNLKILTIFDWDDTILPISWIRYKSLLKNNFNDLLEYKLRLLQEVIINIEIKIDGDSVSKSDMIKDTGDYKKLRNQILFFGWKNGYSITTWPSLPKNLINENNRKIWSELICFNTDNAPQNKNKINLS